MWRCAGSGRTGKSQASPRSINGYQHDPLFRAGSYATNQENITRLQGDRSLHAFSTGLCQKDVTNGGRGYVTKNSSKEEMIKAILEVNHGNKYICDEIKNIISEQLLNEK